MPPEANLFTSQNSGSFSNILPHFKSWWEKYSPFNENKIFCLAIEVNILEILYYLKNETCMLNIDCSITIFVLYIISHNW